MLYIPIALESTVNTEGEEMAANIGMMDSAYFVGRNEILTWINNRLQLSLSRIEEVFPLFCSSIFNHDRLISFSSLQLFA